jgi:hypothetical protein
MLERDRGSSDDPRRQRSQARVCEFVDFGWRGKWSVDLAFGAGFSGSLGDVDDGGFPKNPDTRINESTHDLLSSLSDWVMRSHLSGPAINRVIQQRGRLLLQAAPGSTPRSRIAGQPRA